MAARKSWSKDKEQWLLKLWPKYLSGELSRFQMCKAFDCTPNTLYNHAEKLDLKYKSEYQSEVNLEYLKELGIYHEV